MVVVCLQGNKFTLLGMLLFSTQCVMQSDQLCLTSSVFSMCVLHGGILSLTKQFCAGDDVV